MHCPAPFSTRQRQWQPGADRPQPAGASCVHLFPTPHSVPSCWQLESGRGGRSIYTTGSSKCHKSGLPPPPSEESVVKYILPFVDIFSYLFEHMYFMCLKVRTISNIVDKSSFLSQSLDEGCPHYIHVFTSTHNPSLRLMSYFHFWTRLWFFFSESYWAAALWGWSKCRLYIIMDKAKSSVKITTDLHPYRQYASVPLGSLCDAISLLHSCTWLVFKPTPSLGRQKEYGYGVEVLLVVEKSNDNGMTLTIMIT